MGTIEKGPIGTEDVNFKDSGTSRQTFTRKDSTGRDLTLNKPDGADIQFRTLAKTLDDLVDGGYDVTVKADIRFQTLPTKALDDLVDAGYDVTIKVENAGIKTAILDNNDNEIIKIGATGSAVNEITIKNAATGNKPIIAATGEADTGLILENDQSEEMLILDATASAVNEVTIKNAATGNNPIIASTGEADTGLTMENDQGEEGLILDYNATAVNEVTIDNAATGVSPSIAATGDDTNIDLTLTAKGTGTIKPNDLTPDAITLLGSAWPSFSVHRNNVDQANVVGIDKVEWTTKEYDTNSNFDNSVNYRFTPTVAGKYEFNAQVTLFDQTVGDDIVIYLYKNGAAYKQARRTAQQGAGFNDESYPLNCQSDANGSTDYFEIFIENEDRDTSDTAGEFTTTFWQGSRIA